MTVGMALAVSAGSLDAYTYLTHGGIFAAFQSGNVLKFGMALGSGHFSSMWRYLFSILMFMLGTIVSRLVQHKYENDKKITRSTLIILYEILLLFVVFLVGNKIPNLLSVSILSFAAAAQLQEFRTLEGRPYNNVMMTNNIRSIAEFFYDSRVKKDLAARQRGQKIFLIVLAFSLGAVINGFLVPKIQTFTIFVSIAFLLLAFFLSHFGIRHVIEDDTTMTGV